MWSQAHAVEAIKTFDECYLFHGYVMPPSSLEQAMGEYHVQRASGVVRETAEAMPEDAISTLEKCKEKRPNTHP